MERIIAISLTVQNKLTKDNQPLLVPKDNCVELVNHGTVNCKQGAVSQSQTDISRW